MSTFIIGYKTWQLMLGCLVGGDGTMPITYNNNGGGNAYVAVYGGTPPTPAAFSTYTKANLPATALITFSTVGKGSWSTNTVSVLSVADAVATSTGTATWFVMYSSALAASGGNMIMGDISDANGTGALRMNSTSIVAGTSYGLQDIKITFPTIYTS